MAGFYRNRRCPIQCGFRRVADPAIASGACAPPVVTLGLADSAPDRSTSGAPQALANSHMNARLTPIETSPASHRTLVGTSALSVIDTGQPYQVRAENIAVRASGTTSHGRRRSSRFLSAR